MKIKTIELSGVALDWAVGISRGLQIGNHNGSPYRKDLPGDTYGPGPAWRPSTDWSQGGPLIGQFRVGVVPANVGIMTPEQSAWFATAFFNGEDGDSCCKGVGPTALIAACRAIVGLKLGDEVDVPEGLV